MQFEHLPDFIFLEPSLFHQHASCPHFLRLSISFVSHFLRDVIGKSVPGYIIHVVFDTLTLPFAFTNIIPFLARFFATMPSSLISSPCFMENFRHFFPLRFFEAFLDPLFSRTLIAVFLPSSFHDQDGLLLEPDDIVAPCLRNSMVQCLFCRLRFQAKD